MKRFAAFCLIFVLTITQLCSCSKSPEEQWQEQYDLGVRYLSEGNYEEAIIAFTAAIEIDPNRAEAYVGRGDAYIASGETEENLAAALADYEAALDLDETLVDAWLSLADVYIRQGNYDEAIEILQEGLRVTGNDSSIADKIAEMENTLEEDEPENTEVTQTSNQPGAVSGTLGIQNFQYSYEDDGRIAELNESAEGGMWLSFTVTGPPEVAGVYIWTVSAEGFQENEIPELLESATEAWKSESGHSDTESEDTNYFEPYETNVGFPVHNDDHDTTVDVLLVGVDANNDAVAYAIVTVAIP